MKNTLKFIHTDYENNYRTKEASESYSLHKAILENNVDLFKKLYSQQDSLEQHDEIDENGNTLLMLAVVEENKQIISFLLEKYVSVLEKSPQHGYDALILACAYEVNSEIFNMLLESANLHDTFKNNKIKISYIEAALLNSKQSEKTLERLFTYGNGRIFDVISTKEENIRRYLKDNSLSNHWLTSKIKEYGSFNSFKKDYCQYKGDLYIGPFIDKSIQESLLFFVCLAVIILMGLGIHYLFGVYGIVAMLIPVIMMLIFIPAIIILILFSPLSLLYKLVSRLKDKIFRNTF